MVNPLKKIRAVQLPESSLPFALLLLCLGAYGMLVPYLGFYWDDFPLAWISQKLGPEGLERYFSTNRPFWGMIYKVTTPLLGSEPWRWQVFAIFWRWVSAVLLWGLLRLVWPKAPQAAAWTSMLYIVYPGFTQQFISLIYSHFFIILSAFFLSLFCTVLALRHPRYFWPLTALALLLSLVNLVSMEYFFLLELIRPVVVWAALAGKEQNRKARLTNSLAAWLPYLAVFLGTGVWRAFFFPYQTENYQLVLIEQLKAEPLQTLPRLVGLVGSTFWRANFGAWLQAFRLPSFSELGQRTSLMYTVILLATAGAAALYLLVMQQKDREPQPAQQRWGWSAVTGGILVFGLAGWPFWLNDLAPTLAFPTDRFFLPFMAGACLLAAGLIWMSPVRSWMKPVIVAILVAFALGYQFQQANAYRRDWETQKRFFWQLAWRAPELQPGTILLTNDLPLRFYSDNSLTAPLNWVYTNDADPQQMQFVLFFPSARLGTKLPRLEKDAPVVLDYLAATFSGSTSQVIGIYFNPPACLRVLDPELDVDNRMIPGLMEFAALLTSTDPIRAGETPQLPEQLFGPEPAHRWCYYFEKADLARQLGDWEQVAALGDRAFSLGDYPNDPSERIPFIEGYAHTGAWERALELSSESQDVTPMMQSVLCRLWNRLENTVPDGPEKEQAIRNARTSLVCSP